MVLLRPALSAGLCKGITRDCLYLNHPPVTHRETWLCSSSVRKRASSHISFWKTVKKGVFEPLSTTLAMSPSMMNTEKSGKLRSWVPNTYPHEEAVWLRLDSLISLCLCLSLPLSFLPSLPPSLPLTFACEFIHWTHTCWNGEMGTMMDQ